MTNVHFSSDTALNEVLTIYNGTLIDFKEKLYSILRVGVGGEIEHRTGQVLFNPNLDLFPSMYSANKNLNKILRKLC